MSRLSDITRQYVFSDPVWLRGKNPKKLLSEIKRIPKRRSNSKKSANMLKKLATQKASKVKWTIQNYKYLFHPLEKTKFESSTFRNQFIDTFCATSANWRINMWQQQKSSNTLSSFIYTKNKHNANLHSWCYSTNTYIRFFKHGYCYKCLNWNNRLQDIN